MHFGKKKLNGQDNTPSRGCIIKCIWIVQVKSKQTRGSVQFQKHFMMQPREVVFFFLFIQLFFIVWAWQNHVSPLLIKCYCFQKINMSVAWFQRMSQIFLNQQSSLILVAHLIQIPSITVCSIILWNGFLHIAPKVLDKQ